MGLMRQIFRSDAAASSGAGLGRQLASGTRSAAALRSDGMGGRWTNPDSGQGGSTDRHSSTEFTPPMPLQTMVIDALLEFSGMARRIAERESQDATRRGFELEGFDELATDAIDAEVERIGLLKQVAKGRMWSKAFGGGAVIMVVDDGEPAWKPINWSRLRKLRALRSLDRNEITVAVWDTRSESPTFGEPEVFQLSEQFGTSGFIHRDRVIHFEGATLPRRIVVARQGHGGSVFDLVWAELRNLLSTNDYIAEAVTILSQGVFKVEGLANAIDKDETEDLIARFEALRIGMGMLGDIVVDKENEEYELQSRSIAGVKDAHEALTSAIVAATDMPRSILLGETPGGLNSGENAGEIRSWYDNVAALQKLIYTPAVRRILSVMLRSSEGPTRGQIPDKWSLEWSTLWEPTEGEKADTRLKNAQARALDATGAAVSTDEIRQDPDLAVQYPNLDTELPAPPPPDPMGAPLGDTVLETEEDAEEVEASAPALVESTRRPPAGEHLISMKEAATRLGYNSSSVIVGMAMRDAIGRWRSGAGRWRVAWSEVQAAMSRG